MEGEGGGSFKVSFLGGRVFLSMQITNLNKIEIKTPPKGAHGGGKGRGKLTCKCSI